MIISVEEKIAAMTANLLIKMYWEVREPVQRILFKSPSQRLWFIMIAAILTVK